MCLGMIKKKREIYKKDTRDHEKIRETDMRNLGRKGKYDSKV